MTVRVKRGHIRHNDQQAPSSYHSHSTSHEVGSFYASLIYITTFHTDSVPVQCKINLTYKVLKNRLGQLIYLTLNHITYLHAFLLPLSLLSPVVVVGCRNIFTGDIKL